MKASYLFHARISVGLSPAQVWSSCLPVINSFCTSACSSYHLSNSSPDSSAMFSQSEIVDHLSCRDDGSYLISWRDNNLDTMQSFSYFAKFGKLSFRFANEIVLQSIQEFGCNLAAILPISNLIVQQSSYLEKFREFQIPNRTNLYFAPCYSNGRKGYVEGVSAEMWLGEPFWQFAKCTKQSLLKQEWLHCEEPSSHLYVRAWPEPFSTVEGRQGEIQRKLLDLLFGINSETPPPQSSGPQRTVVQRILLEGENVKDMGMNEKRPD